MKTRAFSQQRPARSVFFGFLLVDALGVIALLLPISRTNPEGVPFMDALFTSTSALCLTGLVVVDTPEYWTTFGHAVILALIQIGGLGVMVFASVLGLTVIRRLSLRSKLTAAVEAKSFGLDNIRQLILSIIKISFTVEGVVALILFAQFTLTYGKSVGEALWLSVFHAISAFNNAGFSLFSDSLMQYVSDPVISIAIAAAIIIGGLGFPVIMQLRKHLRRPLRWSMNTRIVLVGTVALVVLGTVFITVTEWNNSKTLGSLDWPSKVLAGFFQSVQTRTAGFNSVDIGSMHSTTWLGMDIMMFIGGGPAGTAGGIKITTFAVLFFIIVSELKAENAVNIFGKRLSRAVHRQAISVALLSVALVGGSVFILMIITDFSLDQLLFECISAFSTVGLSTGITADIPRAGQLVLIFLMFIGRIGPIIFATALALKNRKLLYELPKERPIIG